MRLLFWVATVVFVLDQVSKYIIVQMMNLREVLAIDVWPPFINLRMAWNDGINFGLLGGESSITRWVLIAVALVICAAVIWWVRTDPAGHWQKIAAGLLVGGALGNVVDRVIYGAVADFLNMSCCGLNNPYSFNVADIAVFMGAAGVVVFSNSEKRA